MVFLFVSAGGELGECGLVTLESVRLKLKGRALGHGVWGTEPYPHPALFGVPGPHPGRASHLGRLSHVSEAPRLHDKARWSDHEIVTHFGQTFLRDTMSTFPKHHKLL